MTDTIAPALTPERWAYIKGRDYPLRTRVGNACDEIDLALSEEGLIAVVNAALPSDSPYKITREDITLLRSAAGAVDSLHGEVCSGACTCAAEEAALDRLAAKLAALLPPE